MTAKRARLGTKSGAGPHFTAMADATGPWACRTNGMASATTATARRRIVGSELRGGEEHSRDSGDGKSRPMIVALMPATSPTLLAKDLRRVVTAAAVGNIIEWYGFGIFGSLATILACKLIGPNHPGAEDVEVVPLDDVANG